MGGVKPSTVYHGDGRYMWELHNTVNKAKLGYRKLRMVKLVECAFGEDLMICAENDEKLQQNVEWWVKELAN